jgi:hypothetical protein
VNRNSDIDLFQGAAKLCLCAKGFEGALEGLASGRCALLFKETPDEPTAEGLGAEAVRLLVVINGQNRVGLIGRIVKKPCLGGTYLNESISSRFPPPVSLN